MSAGDGTTVPPADVASQSTAVTATATATPTTGGNSNTTTQLSEAIDEFLADVEKKFKLMNDEILTKLDDMAERCDRLEAELLLTEAEGAKIPSGSTDNSS